MSDGEQGADGCAHAAGGDDTFVVAACASLRWSTDGRDMGSAALHRR